MWATLTISKVATVVAKDEGPGNHQRNCGFNWPVAECMPVECKNRIANSLERATLLAASRICRISCLRFTVLDL